jgi:HSP20 family protein
MVNLIPWGRRREYGDAGSLLGLRSEMDRLFDQFFESGFGSAGNAPSGLSAMFTPAMDIYEDDNNLVADLEVPGMQPDDIQINVTGNTLTISGEKKEKSESRHEGVIRSERRYGRFFRALELPDDVESENVSAEYDNGVLRLRIPRSETRQPKRISVKAASGGGLKHASGPLQQPGRQQGANRPSSTGESVAGGGSTGPSARGMSTQSPGQSTSGSRGNERK